MLIAVDEHVGEPTDEPDRTPMNLDDRWQTACFNSGLTPNQPLAQREYAGLMSRYQEPHRAYHTDVHIARMFELRDKLPFVVTDDVALAWAIWYHDAIYDPRASDNELQSANLFAVFAGNAALPTDLTERVRSLILVTKSHEPQTPDECVMVDLDLSILGAPEPEFDAYEMAIRQEYAHVPADQFAVGRSRILESFLHKPHIFSSACMAEYEIRARANLARSVERLASGGAKGQQTGS